MMRPIKILIVEDESTIAMMMQSNLMHLGYEVHKPVPNGANAIQKAKDLEIDVILMDIRISGKMDGIEAAQKIREFSNVPIIFLTGYADSRVEERAKTVAPLDFLIKPIDIDNLKSIIDSHFIK
jgi:CheY-like chemotaxis protein